MPVPRSATAAVRPSCIDGDSMRKTYRATFLKQGRWWIGWSADVPGALTQGRTLDEAKANLRDAIRLMLEPVDLKKLPKAKVVQERITV